MSDEGTHADALPPPPPSDAPAAEEPAATQGPATGDPGRSRGAQVALVVGVVVLATLMAWVAIRQGGGDAEPPVTVAGDGVSLTLPPGWNGTADLSSLPDLEGLTSVQEDAMREWMNGVATDDRVRILGVDGFDSVVVLAAEGVRDATLEELVQAYVDDTTRAGYEVVERGETVVDGGRGLTVTTSSAENGEETYDVLWLAGDAVWVTTWSTEIGDLAGLMPDIDTSMATLTTS